MKPILKKQRHYNLLLMKDDSGVFSCRIRGGVLRFFLFFLLLLVAGGAAGIAGGLHYWEKYASLIDRHRLQEKELTDARVQLERLGNLKTLIAASNSTVPQPKTLAQNEEVGATRHEGTAFAATADAGGAAATGPGAVNATVPGSAGNGAGSGGASPVSSVSAPAEIGSGVAGSDSAGAGAAGSNAGGGAILALNGEPSPLRITAFTARPSSRDRLRLRYELSTVSDQRQISGAVRYVAVFSDGARADLTALELAETRFAISRMKVMEPSLRLPRSAKDVEKIELFIDTDDGGRYQERFDIPK